MSKRGYKLQEFVAHSAKVNCLNIGKKACRHFITGGDDHEVNLWAIGKPTSLMSLCGHTSPIESVSFDSSEVLVLAGASNGMIKLWDLEEAKMVRTLTGHRSNCTAVEFHPFGEFCASGSMDTNLKIWDIKKKGCIHTYKGHTQGISTIKFTPDGRWVVSGGLDNVVKVWDLTAGKLLHDFKFHEGHIRSLAFHPLEFLLASGSADKTVKFWDLETFELIGSTRPEATEVRAITFHPDGRSLFSGLDETLKVYSWEPVICHDAVEMGWSTLGDLCIHDGKLLSCSFYRNSVGVWVADIALIEPYGSEKKDQMMLKSNLFSGSQSIASNGASLKALDPCSVPSDEIKEIKTIHVDTSGAKATNTLPTKSLSSPSVVSQMASKEISYLTSHKQSPAIRVMTKLNEKVLDKSTAVPVVVPRDNSEGGKDSTNFVRESVTFSKTKRGMLLRPAQIRRPSNGKIDPEKLPEAVNSGIFSQASSDMDITTNSNFKMRTDSETMKESPLVSRPNVGSVEKVDKILSPEKSGIPGRAFSDLNSMSASNFKTSTDSNATKEYSDGNLSNVRSVKEKLVKILPPEKSGISDRAFSDLYSSSNSNFKTGTDSDATKESSDMNHYNVRSVEGTIDKIPSQEKSEQENGNDPVENGEKMSCVKLVNGVAVIQGRTRKLVDRFERREQTNCNESLERREQTHCNESLERREQTNCNESLERREQTHCNESLERREQTNCNESLERIEQTNCNESLERREQTHCNESLERREQTNGNESRAINVSSCAYEMDKKTIMQKGEPQISGNDMPSANDGDAIEDLMQSHDVFLTGLRSRLTKLQVVRHFWKRNDIKGAINAMTKLPDYSVQADVISVLIEKMDILTLDLFSCLLPVLVGLFDSKIERHVNISMEMLLKLVAVFGPVIRSTVLARPVVGVDLHAEQRLKCCNNCSVQLQKIQKILPSLVIKGGSLARSALELNLVLQQS